MVVDDKVEKAADVDASLQSIDPADDIDLKSLAVAIWKGKWIIILTTVVAIVLSILYALSLPNIYKSEGVFAPGQNSSGGIKSLASQYGGLAAMAGINLGSSESSDLNQAIKLATSWHFLDGFVNKYSLKPLVMAVDEYDIGTSSIIFDRDVYDPKLKKWVGESTPMDPAEPTSYEVYKTMLNLIGINNDPATGLVTLSVRHWVPEIAHQWAVLIMRELNAHFQKRDMEDARRSVVYLENKTNETSVKEMRSLFYDMIETQTQTLMLAEVSEEYLLKTVVPPMIPELKDSPKRALIVVLSTIAGGLLGMMFVVFRYFTFGNSATGLTNDLRK